MSIAWVLFVLMLAWWGNNFLDESHSKECMLDGSLLYACQLDKHLPMCLMDEYLLGASLLYKYWIKYWLESACLMNFFHIGACLVNTFCMSSSLHFESLYIDEFGYECLILGDIFHARKTQFKWEWSFMASWIDKHSFNTTFVNMDQLGCSWP